MTNAPAKILTPYQVEATRLPAVSEERQRFLVEFVNERLRRGERSFYFTLPECDFLGAMATESGWQYGIQCNVPLAGTSKITFCVP